MMRIAKLIRPEKKEEKKRRRRRICPEIKGKDTSNENSGPIAAT